MVKKRANFVFSIYDFEGNGTVDAVNLGDMLRALNLNPTLVTIEKLGGTKKKSKLFIFSIDDYNVIDSLHVISYQHGKQFVVGRIKLICLSIVADEYGTTSIIGNAHFIRALENISLNIVGVVYKRNFNISWLEVVDN
ncbi:hypothetical protein NQ314_012558 [Rhamnusium bicolor]|uniref:EF-hand domain-containing protein n=1 Tax=Rhamnusium bicolor TaxID=1586634 RepID=A0AAV8XAB1_9CUCU|nr:hypothetical protein NQ314_012558 [Rhamnusium bicolor]